MIEEDFSTGEINNLMIILIRVFKHDTRLILNIIECDKLFDFSYLWVLLQ